jgi:hypothetical protein
MAQFNNKNSDFVKIVVMRIFKGVADVIFLKILRGIKLFLVSDFLRPNLTPWLK